MPSQTRKSRRARVGESSVTGGTTFDPTAEQWEELKRAFDNKLTEDVRNRIKESVQSYFDWALHEANAPFVGDVKGHITLLKRAALDLENTLRGDVAELPGNARSYAHSLLQRFMTNPHAPDARRLTWSMLAKSDLIAACTKAEQHLGNAGTGGFEEGRSWQGLMIALTDALASAGLPTGASHDQKNRNRGSDFVELVKALQLLFPEELRRHHLADTYSLAKEINRARSARNAKTGHRVRASSN